MASLNKVFVIGNLTKDPELRFVPSGSAVCNLRLATNRKYKTSAGEWKEEVTYLSVEAWGKSAEACGEYLKKGSPLMVEGRLKLKEWEKDGQKRSMVEIVAERIQFLNSRNNGGSAGEPGEAPHDDASPTMNDDDIPF